MGRKSRGLFVVGTDTGVGKTRVAAMIARQLHGAGHAVGVYKPAASGCELRDGRWMSSDAQALWQAAGQPATLHDVCPQCFEAPIAPHLAARQEDRAWDSELLRAGEKFWRERSDIVIVEGAGGLLSPMGDDEFVADLAVEFGYPVVVVAPNRIGVINQALQTLVVAFSYGPGIDVAGVVLNDIDEPSTRDPSRATNRQELALRCVPPILTHLGHNAAEFPDHVDWWQLAASEDDDAA